MARTETVLRVFVASPSDVSQEVATIEAVIKELNATSTRHIGVRLEMVTWQTDVLPGVSTDTQAVINEQIGEDYDIFIGILWSRFGNATPRAGSGTEEEFERAYARYQQQPKHLRIMIYFKRSAISPDNIEPEQFGAVECFRKRLREEKGTLYSDFDKPEEFESLLRSHLTRQLHEWGKTWGVTDNSPISNRNVELSTCKPEMSDIGALDLLETSVEEIGKATKSAEKIGQLLTYIGSQAGRTSAQLNKLQFSDDPNKTQDVKFVINSLASDLDQFARGLTNETEALSRSLLAGLNAFSKLLTYSDCFSAKDMAELAAVGEVILSLEIQLKETKGVNVSLKDSIANLPRITTSLNRAKRSAVEAIHGYDGTIARALALARDAKKNYDDLLVGEPSLS
jgi:hypothetical protein